VSYGYCLWLEGRTARNVPRVNDESAVSNFLREVIEAVGMTLAAGPFTYREPFRDIGKGPGVTGVAILVESSIHIHTYPEQGFFFFELFSCNSFFPGMVRAMVEEFVVSEGMTDYFFREVGAEFPAYAGV